MPIPSNIQEALDRLGDGFPTGYNNQTYNAATNPHGFLGRGYFSGLFELTADVQLVTTYAAEQMEIVLDVQSDIEAVAGALTEITAVSNALVNITTVAGLSTAIAALAAIDDDISTVAGMTANISTVIDALAAINSVADNMAAVLAAEGHADAAAASAVTAAAVVNSAEKLAIFQTYESSTVNAAPAVGAFRFSSDIFSANPGDNVTLRISTTDLSGGNITGRINLLDDSTNTANRAQLLFIDELDTSIWVEAFVNAANSAQTGYINVSLTVVGRNGAGVNGNAFALAYQLTGNKGADGLGSGDVVGPAGVTDGRVAIFVGATGKLIGESPYLPSDFFIGNDADNMVEGENNLFLSDVERLKLANIADGADVTGLVASSSRIVNLGLAFSVNAGALTIALKQADGATDPAEDLPVIVSMRSSTASSAAFNERQATGPITLVVPSTATLGQFSTITSLMYFYLIDNAGTLELAVSGLDLGESGIVSTTAMGTGSDLSTVIYSASARANVPFRKIGSAINAQAVAGTWDTLPSRTNVAPFPMPNVSRVNYFTPYDIAPNPSLLGRGDATVDTPVLQTYLNHIAMKNEGVAQAKGEWSINAALTLGVAGDAAAGATKEIVGDIKITATVAMEQMITVDNYEHLILPERLSLYGPGGATYATRTVGHGLFIKDAPRMKVANFRGENFLGFGLCEISSFPDNSNFVLVEELFAQYCGSGMVEAGYLGNQTATFSGRTNSGTTGDLVITDNTAQRTQLTGVTTIPPAYITNKIPAGQALLALIDGLPYRVVAIAGTAGNYTVDLYPRVTPFATTSGDIDWLYGGGAYVFGSDANTMKIGRADVVTSGFGIVDQALYGINVGDLQTQSVGCAYAFGIPPSSNSAGGGLGSMYNESSNIWDIIQLSSALASTNHKAIQTYMTAPDLNKYRNLSAPIANATQEVVTSSAKMETLAFTYDMLPHTFEKLAKNATETFSSISISMSDYRVTGFRTNAKTFNILAAGDGLNDLTGRDNKFIVVSGTGTNDRPTGNLIFQPPVGATINGLRKFTATITNGANAVVTSIAHGLADGDPFRFSNEGGALPGGAVAGTTYYVKLLNADNFNFAATPGGANITTTSAGSGTHTVTESALFAGFSGPVPFWIYHLVATDDYRVEVMGPQSMESVDAWTGTQTRTTKVAYAGATHTGAYVQATIQALDNAVRDVSQAFAALNNDLRSGGITK